MKRLKQILKWTGVVLGGLVAIGLVANAVFVWTTDARLERQLAEIRAAGDPVTLADLAPKPIPPEKNAATYLRKAEADVEAIDYELRSPEILSLIKGGDNLSPMPPKVQKAVRAALDAHPKVIPLLQQAAACPDYAVQLELSPLPEKFQDLFGVSLKTDYLNSFRYGARVLRYRAALLVAEGNRDEAVRTSLVIFRLAHNCGRNPTLLAYLVAITVRDCAIASVNEALQTGTVSKEVRDALDAELARHESMNIYRRAIVGDRAYGIALHAHLPARNFWLACRVYWNRQESAYLDAMQELLSLADNPASHRQEEKTLEKVRSAEGICSVLIAPAVQNMHHFVMQSLALVRCLRVLNALQTHVPAGSKEVPKLTELGLPVETITDPFTGEPLQVKKTPQGWLVYSVGQNFKDDGGKLDDPTSGDVGVGPPPPAVKPVRNDYEKKKL
jgi:hypothetical protein